MFSRNAQRSAATAAIAVAAACFLGARADTWLAFPGAGSAIVFPPYAILTAVLLRARPRHWPMFMLAASAGNYLPHRAGGAPASFVLLAELVNQGRALTAALGLRRFTDARARFATIRDVVGYVGFAIIIAPCAAAFAGAGLTVWLRAPADYWLVFREWFLSNAITALTLLPLLMIDAARVRRALSPARLAEAGLLGAGLLGAAITAFLSPIVGASLHPTHVYWPLPFLLWAALRFGPHGASGALLAVSALSAWGAFHGRGPFAAESATENLLELQLFLLVVSVPFLLLSVVVEQERALAEQRRALDARRSLETALREADRRKDEFLAMLGHELRNPLTPIGLAMEIVRKAAPESQEAVWARETVKRQVAHLTRLVDDLLDVSRVALGRVRLDLAVLDLRAVVENAAEAAQPLFETPRRALTVALPARAVAVRGDFVRLTQVVSNLLKNAAKYTGSGGSAHVSVRHDGAAAEIVVRDDGVGIPADALHEIFELFRQLPGARDRSQGGLGIGLTLVKRFVELHGGTVVARSEGAGRGAEFVVRLPALATAVPEARLSTPSGPISPHARRVLVVDDNVDIAEGLARIVGSWGHVVRVAHDGASALATARELDPELVLIDLGLPDMGGQDVARRLREARTRARLVSMSGFDPIRARRSSGEGGFDAHLVKPLDVETLRMLFE